MNQPHTIAIIGAGASGCFAAANIPYRAGQEVIVFEKAARPMQKVKVSGGGRCNVTHACFDIPELVKRYPRGTSLLKKALHHFSPAHTVEWFAQRAVEVVQEADGRMFPATNDSQTIIDAIWREMMAQQVTVRYGKGVKTVARDEGRFRITFDDGSDYTADKVLLACGSILKPEQLNWLTSLGHTIVLPAPSLFTFNLPKNPITELMGLSVPDALVKITGTKFAQRGPLLITHWGFSGPAVLRTSAWAARALQEKRYEFTVLISWVGDLTEADVRAQFAMMRQQQGRQLLHGKNPFELPRRLWEFLLSRSGIDAEVKWGELAAAAQNKLVTALAQDAYEVRGKTTFKEEFVTCGGVATNEINPQTMESRLIPGLYFAGEAVDVDGITGGYNFQHAWCSGWLAAKGLSLAEEQLEGGTTLASNM